MKKITKILFPVVGIILLISLTGCNNKLKEDAKISVIVQVIKEAIQEIEMYTAATGTTAPLTTESQTLEIFVKQKNAKEDSDNKIIIYDINGNGCISLETNTTALKVKHLDNDSYSCEKIQKEIKESNYRFTF